MLTLKSNKYNTTSKDHRFVNTSVTYINNEKEDRLVNIIMPIYYENESYENLHKISKTENTKLIIKEDMEGLYVFVFYNNYDNKWYVSTLNNLNLKKANFIANKIFLNLINNDYSIFDKNYVYHFNIISQKLNKIVDYSYIDNDKNYKYLELIKITTLRTNKEVEDKIYTDFKKKIKLYDNPIIQYNQDSLFLSIYQKLEEYDKCEFNNLSGYLKHKGLTITHKDEYDNISLYKIDTNLYDLIKHAKYTTKYNNITPINHLFYYNIFNEKHDTDRTIKRYFDEEYISDKKYSLEITILHIYKILYRLYILNSKKGLDKDFYIKIPKSIKIFMHTINKYRYDNKLDKIDNQTISKIIDKNINLYYSIEANIPKVLELAIEYHVNIIY
jgi:hypothetical protein